MYLEEKTIPRWPVVAPFCVPARIKPTWRDILLSAADDVERGWVRFGATSGDKKCSAIAISTALRNARYDYDEFLRVHGAVYAALKAKIGAGNCLDLGRWNSWQWSGKTVAAALRTAAQPSFK